MNIDIVIVTYNRLEKLKKALDSYDIQGDLFRNLIVVNNHSTDGTKEFLDDWYNFPSSYSKVIIHSNENLGGSGGFCLGQKRALELGADWIFVADDDAYADKEMLSQFWDFSNAHNTDGFAAICAAVLNPDGTICFFHRQRWNLKQGKYFEVLSSTQEDYDKEYFNIQLLTYVGSFIKAEALRRVGTVNKDYFIYYDDYEHSFRLKKEGEIICVPSIRIVHDSTPSTGDSSVSWKDFYMIRNLRHMLIHHMPKKVALRYILAFIIKRGNNITAEKEYLRIYKKANWDAMIGRLGIDSVYRPGWQVKK